MTFLHRTIHTHTREVYLQYVTTLFFTHILTSSAAIGEKHGPFADVIDQNQTAQNVQSDLNLCHPLVWSSL